MATKTFKIGLNNAEKQAMAQDVYERLLDLTFPEYDTSASYSVGDFVVYNDQLYKCIGATSGAWDSSKWQLATLNDLLTDIESAVAFVNDKANVDGNYPTMTVGVADQLSPYDEEAGDDQDEPFSFQATGTGNGSQPDFSTGSIALMKEKQGNTVVVNQKVGLNAITTQTVNDITCTNNGDGSYTLSGTASGEAAFIGSQISLVIGHKILIFGGNAKVGIGITLHGDTTSSKIVTAAYSNSSIYLVVNNGTDLTTTVTIKPFIIDLTQWFNGDIPADLLSHPENFFRYYQCSLAYNAGTLVNSNGRYVKCIGRNQWDEEWELGSIDGDTGENTSSSTRIRSKNYIPVIPNANYFLFNGQTSTPASSFQINWYDKDKKQITKEWGFARNHYLSAPSNAVYMRFFMDDYYGTTYNHDITISLYYSGESGYDQYYPYELLTDNDTGVEVLRSARNAHDIKLPSGEIKRNVGTYTFTGNEIWDEYGSSGAKACSINDLGAKTYEASVTPNVTSDTGLQPNNRNNIYNGSSGISVSGTGIYVSDNTNLTGKTIHFELATPTTEQGTSYSENVAIDDFGSMDFGGTNGVPQGNLIFYPVDYKAFIDTLYNNTDGTPSNIALKSDLASDKSELQGIDTQLQNAIGGTLRQCLCTLINTISFNNTKFVDLGTLNWDLSGAGNFFIAIQDLKTNSYDNQCSLCSNYQYDATNGNIDKTCWNSSGTIYIRDTSYTDPTTFKNAMKGVLLAYEKASS